MTRWVWLLCAFLPAHLSEGHTENHRLGESINALLSIEVITTVHEMWGGQVVLSEPDSTLAVKQTVACLSCKVYNSVLLNTHLTRNKPQIGPFSCIVV